MPITIFLLQGESGNSAEWASVVVNAFLFLVVIAQAEINRRQLKVTGNQTQTLNQTLEHTQTAHHISERAYVGISQIDDDGETDDLNGRILRIRFKNGGRTPAWNFSATARIHHANRSDEVSVSLREDADVKALNDVGYFMMAGETHSLRVAVPFFLPSSPIPKEDQLVYIVGQADYRDFKGSWQVFRFVYLFDPDTRNLKQLSNSQVEWEELERSVDGSSSVPDDS